MNGRWGCAVGGGVIGLGVWCVWRVHAVCVLVGLCVGCGHNVYVVCVWCVGSV